MHNQKSKTQISFHRKDITGIKENRPQYRYNKFLQLSIKVVHTKWCSLKTFQPEMRWPKN